MHRYSSLKKKFKKSSERKIGEQIQIENLIAKREDHGNDDQHGAFALSSSLLKVLNKGLARLLVPRCGKLFCSWDTADHALVVDDIPKGGDKRDRTVYKADHERIPKLPHHQKDTKEKDDADREGDDQSKIKARERKFQ